MKIHQHNAGHMTKIAAMPMYGENTLKIFFPGTTGLTLYEVSETLTLYYLCKLCPWVDLDLFYGKVKSAT